MSYYQSSVVILNFHHLGVAKNFWSYLQHFWLNYEFLESCFSFKFLRVFMAKQASTFSLKMHALQQS